MGGVKQRFAGLAASMDLDSPQPAEQSRASTGKPTTAVGSLAQMAVQHDQLVDELIRLQKSAGGAVDLPLELIDPSPFQTRRLDEEQVAALVENLRVNPLTTPIAVRKVSEGRFELLAGHHRAEAYRRLGKEPGGEKRFDAIKATVVEMPDAQAVVSVFLDNLVAPKLSDFEAYLGFAQMASFGGASLSQRELAAKSGVPLSVVNRLMAFEKLPADCIEVLKEHRDAIGATAAVALTKLPPEAMKRVPEGLRLVVKGELGQGQLAAWAKGEMGSSAHAKQEETFKRGRSTFATMKRSGEKLVVSFKLEADARAFEKAAREALKRIQSEQAP